jgi:hypothetical protein
MLLKHRDGRQAEIRELKGILGLGLGAEQRSAAELELASLLEAEKQEQSLAQYLDFRYEESGNWALIHDLRIEHHLETARFDHLLIDRFLDVYVIESRNFDRGMKITEEGLFMLWDGNGYVAAASPLERNLRQIEVLRQSVGERDLGPRRLGYPIPLKYRNVVLFSAASNLIKPGAAPVDLGAVHTAEEFVSLAGEYMTNKSILDASKMVSYDVLREFGEKLVRLHRRAPAVDYFERFGVLVEPTDGPRP